MSGGHDDNVLEERGAWSNAQLPLGGTWQAANIALRLSSHSPTVTVVTNVTASGRYYQDLSSLNSAEGEGDVGVLINRRWGHFLAVQRVRQQPYYQFAFPGATPFEWSTEGGNSDFLIDRRALSTEGRVGLSRRAGRNGTLVLDYGYRRSTLAGMPQPFLWQTASAAYRRTVTRHTALRLGYAFDSARDAQHGRATSIEMHTIDAGVDVSRPVARSQRTRVTFRSGSSLVSHQRATSFRLLGEAGISRALAQSWNAALAFRRNVSFHEAFAGPLATDALDATFGGAVSSRIRLRLSGTYGRAERDIRDVGQRYATRGTGCDLELVMTRTFSIVTRYGYYRYSFGSAIDSLAGLPGFRRQSFRIGVTGSF